MKAKIRIRDYLPGDEVACVAIYIDAVRNGTAPHYTAEEAAAWAPDDHDPADWTERLAESRTFIACVDGEPQGFLTFTPGGHLDLFFVRPAARDLQLAAMLYDRMIETAREMGLEGLTTHASHLARRFLDRRGWAVVEEERNLRHGVWLTRFLMALEKLPR